MFVMQHVADITGPPRKFDMHVEPLEVKMRTATYVFQFSLRRRHGYKYQNKKLSCRREAARCFASLNILLSHSRSFEMTLVSMAYLSPY